MKKWTKREYILLVAEELEYLADDGNVFYATGLKYRQCLGVCDWLDHLLCSDSEGWQRAFHLSQQVDKRIKEWGFFSGDYQYPIPFADGELQEYTTPETEEEPHAAFMSLKHWAGDYGWYRREYCGWMAGLIREWAKGVKV